MEGYATKRSGIEHSDADIQKSRYKKSSSSRIVSRMYVEGYDTSLSSHDFVMSMRKHFASCGEVIHVYIPGYAEHFILNRFALIYIRGEGAEEKALKLSGSCMGAHKLVVESYPFHAKHLDHVLAPMRYADNKENHTIFVDGYDTSLPSEYVKSMMFEEFSQCGPVLYIDVLSRCALVEVEGIETIEKLLQLCGCDQKGLENIKLTKVAPPQQDGASSCNMPPMLFAAAAPNLPNPPCPGNILPYPWQRRVDGGHSSIWNTVTGEQFEIPPSSGPVRYAPEDPNLPKPWKGLVDNSIGYVYYWNTETNVTQYERPPSSAPPLLLQ